MRTSSFWLLRALALVGTLGWLVVAAVPAGAHQSPAGCLANSLQVDIAASSIWARNGDNVTYVVSMSNPKQDNGAHPGCDISSLDVTFVSPAPDGTATGAHTVLGTGLSLAAGTPSTILGAVTYKVAANPGVSAMTAEVMTNNYILHETPSDVPIQEAHKSLATLVTQPHTDLSVTVSPTSGQAPLPVTFTYTEKNSSTTPGTAITNVALTDSACSPLKFVGGDTNNNGKLDVGETWTYTCSTTLTTPGVVTTAVKGTGIDSEDAQATPVESASTTVTVAAKPTPPTTVLGTTTKKPILPVTGPTTPLGPLTVLAAGLLLAGAGLMRRTRSRAGGR